jgi:Zn finger protein HypA/HybF involved in hydrogenase expression
MSEENIEENQKNETEEQSSSSELGEGSFIERKETTVVELRCNLCHNKVQAGQIDPATFIVFCPKCHWAEFINTEQMKKLQEIEIEEPK